jgi:hypothetical protein
LTAPAPDIPFSQPGERRIRLASGRTPNDETYMTSLVMALTTFAFVSSTALSGPAVAVPDNWTPLSFTIFNECTGEAIEVSGVAHITTRTWTEGDRVFVRGHTNMNLSGVGLSSGRRYQLHQSTVSAQVIDVTNGVTATDQVHHLSLISGGRMPNAMVTMNGIVLVDPAGNATVIPKKWEATCK